MSEQLATQQVLLHTISRALDNFKKIGRNNYSPAKIRSQITSLKETWAQCMQGHAVLLQLYPGSKRESLPYFQEKQLEAYEDIYNTALDYMAECLEDLEPAVNANRTIDSQKTHGDSSFSLRHLPPIQFPPFSRKFEEWESFRDRFQALIIQNKELSDFSRMHFLASSLTGRALDAIASTPITADNFEGAWKSLQTRYENKRRLIEMHVTTLYTLRIATRESASEFHALRDKADKAISALRRLDRKDILNDVLVYFVSQKLDHATRRAWKLKFDDSPPPTFEDLSRFLSSRAAALEELAPPHSSKTTRKCKVTSASTSTALNPLCVLCKNNHFINKCPLFTGKSPHQRQNIVKQFKRCFNCLSAKHAVAECKSKFNCRTCQKRHHSTLHVDSVSSSSAPQVIVPTDPLSLSTELPQVNALSAITAAATPSPVLLATAKIRVISTSGRAQIVRALLDQGSEVTFISEQLAQILRLRRVRTLTSISAVGGVNAGICRHATQIHITPRNRPAPTFSALAFIMKSLTRYIPRRSQLDVDWGHLTQLDLADDDPTGLEPIDVIIGADLYSSVILDGVRKGLVGQSIEQNSYFGWVISGPTSCQASSSRHINVLHCSLEQELRRFWEIEELPQPRVLSPDENQCEEHFVATHSRMSDGRYIVRLLFKEGPPIGIGESRAIAARLLATLNRRLNIRPELKREYDAFLAEYEQLGHMKRVPPPSASNSQVVYIPHHSVIKASSLTTRVRVVFNASSATSNGTSLNNYLLPGPKLQTDLSAVLLKWRQYKYVCTADIAKMYRQILIDPRDRDYQRIMWNVKDSPSMQEFQMLTVTYGTAPTPFLALRVLRQLVHDESDSFPLASSILQDHIYVDDVIFGADDIPLLRQARDQVCTFLRRGGFELRKWASNNSNLLADISPDNHGLACTKSLQPDENLSVLGITWTPAVDVFQFHVSLPSSLPSTKRTILSTIAKLFDPLG